jgi:tetraacyldisaccharide 4'-kinase
VWASELLSSCFATFNRDEKTIQSSSSCWMNRRWIHRVWRRRGLLGILLWLLFLPISCLYWLAVQARNLFYSVGWKRPRYLKQFVISIGNLTVGGTGKTPTVVWMAQELQKRGFRIAVLSRGYARRGNRPRALTSNCFADVDELGDEPTMMARLFGLNVAVGNSRYEAALEIVKHDSVDVFILDDAFQHRQLARDIDLLLLGSDCTGWLLPSGPFREPKRAIRRADLLLMTGAQNKWERLIPKDRPRLAFQGSLQPMALIGFESRRWKEYPLGLLARRKIAVVTAVANPESFYRMISEWEGEIVDVFEFPDHHRYSSRDWQRLNQSARNADLIVTTEKDIVKLNRFPFAREKLLALRVAMVVAHGDALIDTIVNRIQKKEEGFR